MMIYLLQVSTCWIVLYGIFKLFLQKETFFTINRYYLLGSLIAGLLIPLLGGFIPANQTSTEIYQVMNQVSFVEITPLIEQQTTIFTWLNLLYILYSIGALIVFLRFVYGLFRIYNIFRFATKTKNKNYTLVESSKFHLPFSFFHYIFISKELSLNDDVEKVLRHEELHAHQWHSLDIVITELLQVFFWFNPILIFYKNALKQSHEFLADAYVTRNHNRSSYGQLLLRQSTSGLEIALANQFFHSQIKKRITMLYKEKSKRPAMVKYLAAIPVLAAMLFIFSSSKMDNQSKVNPNDECLSILIVDHNTYSTNGEPLTILEFESKINGNSPPKCVDLIYNHSTYINSVTPILKAASQANISVHFKNGGIDKLIDFEINNPYYYYDSKEEKFKLKERDDQGDPIFRVVEEMPRFPGCEKVQGSSMDKEKCAKQKMLEFIYENLEYPTTARNASIEGMTVIQFIVGKDGKISEGKIVRDIGGGCGLESLKVINSMPTWTPGKQKGKAVRVQYTIPIKFKLESKKLSSEEKNHIVNVTAFGKKSVTATKDNLAINKQNSLPNENLSEQVYKVVDEMPRFPGCENSEVTLLEKNKCAKQKMLEFIYTQIKYPREARDEGVEGMAIVQFIIEKDGSVSSSITVRDPGAGTGAEAKRIVDNMPKWVPGKQQGKIVRVKYTLPIKYKLEGDNQPSESYKIINNSLSATEDEFKSLKNIETLLAETGLSSDCKVKKYRIVHVAPKKDATVSLIKEGSMSDFTKKQIQNASIGDKYFFETIICQCPGDKEAENRGGFHVTIRSNDEKITSEVDQIPLFPGTSTKDKSVELLSEFVFQNITYPEKAKQTGIEGLAIVKFVVTADGQIQKIHLTKSPGWGIDETVMNMMDKMKEIESPWTPAYHDNKNVNYEYVLPVKFKLKDHQKAETKSKKLDLQLLKINPNPSNGIFTLAFNIEDKSPADITFYSASGQTIKSIKQVNVPFTKSIDLTEHQGQTIYVRIMQKGKAHTEKVIIQ